MRTQIKPIEVQISQEEYKKLVDVFPSDFGNFKEVEYQMVLENESALVDITFRNVMWDCEVDETGGIESRYVYLDVLVNVWHEGERKEAMWFIGDSNESINTPELESKIETEIKDYYRK